ncbi:MAG: endonuclease MutS2 [Bacteroidota bacterium]|jgi:DNA mismatch repair protein MutS2
MREFLNSFSKLEFDKLKNHIQRYASSPLGKELIQQLTPFTSIEEIRASLALVSEMKRLLEEHEYPPLDHVPDVRVSLHHSSIENFVLPPEELHKIQLLLETSKKVTSYFKQKKDKYPLLHSRIQRVQVHKVLEYNIREAIDDDGVVKDNATKDLARIRKRIVEKKDQLRAQLESILKSLVGKEWVQEEIITTRDGRMVVPVRTEYKNRVPGFIHSSSSSGATVFIEPSETLESNNDLRTLQFQEQREIERILRELTQQVRDAREALSENLQSLSFLDFIAAKAKYSIEVLGAEPIIKSDGHLHLMGARHPLLLQRHKREEVVPLDVELTSPTRTIIITGPNAGGKSVALKTIGILNVLMQSGCHIPASAESELPVFSELFVDIGDEQSIEDDLSSFSSHLKNLKEVLHNATKTSLILLDEIGSGTDPVEGSSLAAAVLESLTAIGCVTVATTHHGSLKTFAYETPGIENAAMEFDQSTLLPTYHFRIGLPGSSYAIEMAERMSVPRTITDRAKQMRGSGANSFENLILELERQSQKLASDLELVRTEKLQLNALITHYQNQISTLEKELKSIKLKAANEATAIILKANSAIEAAIQMIKEQGAGKEAIKAAKQEIKDLAAEVESFRQELEPTETSIREFTIGTLVKLRQTNSIGEIIEETNEGDYTVLMGGIKVKVDRRELEPATGPTMVAPAQASALETATAKREIDLRGMYGDEAIEAIDKFLDSAMISGLHRVDIIHGKGTGALRKRVGEYLKKNPSVKAFRLGEWNEGGAGVTVVELT